MKLTGKALEHFGLFLVSNYKIADWDFFYKKPIVSQNALIIEWFETVKPNQLKGNKFIDMLYVSLNRHNYKEATEKAIEKANELYNENT